jgi:hypothetical protein
MATSNVAGQRWLSNIHIREFYTLSSYIHAALDWTVIRPNGLAQYTYHPDEAAVANGIIPATYSNPGSSDAMGCVAHYDGAIGYADSDKRGSMSNPCESGVCRIDYNGFVGNRENVRNGRYDFWTASFLLASPEDSARQHVVDLIDFMEDPNTLDGTPMYEWWATQDEMKVTRSSCKTGIKIK